MIFICRKYRTPKKYSTFARNSLHMLHFSANICSSLPSLACKRNGMHGHEHNDQCLRPTGGITYRILNPPSAKWENYTSEPIAGNNRSSIRTYRQKETDRPKDIKHHFYSSNFTKKSIKSIELRSDLMNEQVSRP